MIAVKTLRWLHSPECTRLQIVARRQRVSRATGFPAETLVDEHPQERLVADAFALGDLAGAFPVHYIHSRLGALFAPLPALFGVRGLRGPTRPGRIKFSKICCQKLETC